MDRYGSKLMAYCTEEGGRYFRAPAFVDRLYPIMVWSDGTVRDAISFAAGGPLYRRGISREQVSEIRRHAVRAG